MTRMIAERTYATEVTAPGDGVLAGLWLPGKSRLRSCRGYVLLEATTVSTAQQFHMAAIEGWALPVQDPDSGATMQTLFDQLVPKDKLANTMDLDTVATDSVAFFEPADVDWSTIIPIGLIPQRLFHWHGMFSMGQRSLVVNQDPESPFGFQHIPGTRVNVQFGPIAVDQPTLIVIGLASPDLVQTSSSNPISMLGEAQWGQVRYIDHVLERAMLSLLGVTEAGAETPWEEAAVLLRNHLNPDIFETTGATFISKTWRGAGEFFFDHDVEGSLPTGMISFG